MEKFEEAQKTYQASEKGKSARLKYLKSPKGREAQKKYLQSDKGREAQLRYRLSQKGKIAQKQRQELEKAFRKAKTWLDLNPDKTFEDYLKTHPLPTIFEVDWQEQEMRAFNGQ